MIIGALAITLCAVRIGSPCAPCEIPVGATGTETPLVKCISVSREFMEIAKTRIIPFEGKFSADPRYPDSNVGWDAIGDQGRAFGPLQVRCDIHQERMRALGLDCTKQEHLFIYSEILWREQGLKPWYGAQKEE